MFVTVQRVMCFLSLCVCVCVCVLDVVCALSRVCEWKALPLPYNTKQVSKNTCTHCSNVRSRVCWKLSRKIF